MSERENILPGLQVDDSITQEILDLCKWARFLGILSFVLCVLIELLGVYLVYTVYELTNKYRSVYSNAYQTGASFGVAFFYCIIGIIWFFPSLFLYQAGKRLKQAVDGLAQDIFAAGVAKLKACLRFWAIALLLMVLVFIFLAIFSTLK